MRSEHFVNVYKMATMEDVDEYELERLRAELQQEKQMTEMLNQSAGELKLTVDQLEKRFDSVENEGNEWKTRFETQEEMNQQLEKQILLLQDKVEQTRQAIKEGKEVQHKSPRSGINLEESNPHMIKMMEREKQSLAGQLRDLEWRLDQESKAYHKANEERKNYMLEINSAKYKVDALSKKRNLGNVSQREEAASKTPRETKRNIPEDQRIIDPKRGPIKKTAAVQRLPKLDGDSSHASTPIS